VKAIRSGDVERLARLLDEHAHLAHVRIADDRAGGIEARSLLHVVADWPGHVRNGAALVRVLAEAGADVTARFIGTHAETPLHWAASGDDVDVLDALVAGADLEADGAVIAGGTPLDDAVAFGQWRAARRLVERGARTAAWHAAALGLIDSVAGHFAGRGALPALHPWGAGADPAPRDLDVAFWCACHGGQRLVGAHLLALGAELDWVAPWDGLTPLGAALRSDADDVVAWLVAIGARRAGDITEA
jgi:ankyrin repeat protein